jgi:hypothetical protein
MGDSHGRSHCTLAPIVTTEGDKAQAGDLVRLQGTNSTENAV